MRGRLPARRSLVAIGGSQRIPVCRSLVVPKMLAIRGQTGPPYDNLALTVSPFLVCRGCLVPRTRGRGWGWSSGNIPHALRVQ